MYTGHVGWTITVWAWQTASMGTRTALATCDVVWMSYTKECEMTLRSQLRLATFLCFSCWLLRVHVQSLRCSHPHTACTHPSLFDAGVGERSSHAAGSCHKRNEQAHAAVAAGARAQEPACRTGLGSPTPMGEISTSDLLAGRDVTVISSSSPIFDLHSCPSLL